jgi:NTE family protein
VLDRLLEEPRLKIEGISGTSAGAMNAAVLAHGHAADGSQGAKAALEDFWRRVSRAAMFSPFRRTPLDIMMGRWTIDTSHLAHSPIRLFVTATNVRTGRGRVFRNAELTPEALLASACLPTMFQAIEIDGDPYWDGGYVGNPTITPLVRECASSDTLLVQVNPIERPGTPRSAREILDRLNEVSFNSPLMKELRLIAVLRQVANTGDCEGARWAGMRIHRIASDMMTELGSSSKLNAEWEFFCMLRDEGRRCAHAFLKDHAEDLGRRSTLDLDQFLENV